MSYLEDRKQTVIIRGSCSAATSVKVGVPQGSVLGSLLFPVHLTPLPSIIENHGIDHHGYADDRQLYTTFSSRESGSLEDSLHRIERCVNETENWMAVNKFKVNPQKTEGLIIAAPQYTPFVKGENPTLRVANDIIVPVETRRNLGITFDGALTMKPCINNITRNCIRSYLDDTTCAAVMQALVISRLDAKSLLTGLPACTLRKLVLVQNSAARVLTETSCRARITPVLRELHWLPVARRITYKVLCLVYKALHEISAPADLRSLLCEHRSERELRSSAATTLVVPRSLRS